MTSEKPVVTKTLEGIIPFEDPDVAGFTNDCSAVWHPSGKQFYIATRTHEIISVSRDTWAKNGTFPSSDEISGVRLPLPFVMLF
jgi:chromosome transmission fidelity protein 4